MEVIIIEEKTSEALQRKARKARKIRENECSTKKTRKYNLRSTFQFHTPNAEALSGIVKSFEMLSHVFNVKILLIEIEIYIYLLLLRRRLQVTGRQIRIAKL